MVNTRRQEHAEEEESHTDQRVSSRSTRNAASHNHINGKDIGHMTRRSSRRLEEESPAAASHQLETEEEHEEHRRSSRQRKFLYDTFDQEAMTRQTHHYRSSRSDREQQHSVQENGEEGEELDMYTRVKRVRRQVKRDMYGMPIMEEEEEGKTTEDDESTENDEEQEDEEQHDEEEQSQNGVQYNLRQNKPQTKHYEATIEKKSKHNRSFFKDTPPKRRYRERHRLEYKSPAHRSRRRKKAAFNKNSSTSSSGSDSEDERKFERRKKKSMARARQRCLPMNLTSKELTGVMKDRQKIGASLADIDPMSLDRSVTFDSVGGLSQHIQALKEMIVFPLVYPEVFERFKIAPPRGVLFHGPPGTGKTLVARALANECSHGEKRVSFFMRKGADCLSKWVGESERQLRLLFDQAYQMRPSIIFFDEIDGLAPVRSSRQDQIHSSIVSTLLALMDGLDSRGEVVIIGATNRIDSIDPALRRPGRFDREFLFSLPSAEARAQILKIHTKEWNPQLLNTFVKEVAAKCNGYCGADMKALCTEASLHALRRRYPQIYTSGDKLQLDVTSIDITARDFHQAMTKIVPAGQRSAIAPGRPLSLIVKPLLKEQLKKGIQLLNQNFPYATQQQNGSSESTLMDNLLDFVDDDSQSACISENKKKKSTSAATDAPFMDFSVAAYHTPIVSRPRLCIYGSSDQGHTTHIAPAILHNLEKLPVHVLDLPTLYANSSRTPEESCAQIFREARRSTPSVIYVPHIDQWWEVLSETMRATFLMLLNDLDPLIPILLLATSEKSQSNVDLHAKLFNSSYESYALRNPLDQEIRLFFQDLLLNQTCVPPPSKKQAAQNLLEVLPKAPAPKPVQLSEAEKKALWDHEEAVLRELRLFLRDILNKLARDRKFNIFAKPVDLDDVPDYYEIIKNPMDLYTMMSKIDLHQYQTVQDFLEDISLICQNALEYNPDTEPAGRAIRHRACALKDMAFALIDAELDQEFEKQCLSIQDSRKNRGTSPNKSAPRYYHTRPLPSGAGRYSRRLRGEDACEAEMAERTKALLSQSLSTKAAVRVLEDDSVAVKAEKIQQSLKKRENKPSSPKSPHSISKKRNKSPWCRSRRKRRRRQPTEEMNGEEEPVLMNGAAHTDEQSSSENDGHNEEVDENELHVEEITSACRDLSVSLDNVCVMSSNEKSMDSCALDKEVITNGCESNDDIMEDHAGNEHKETSTCLAPAECSMDNGTTEKNDRPIDQPVHCSTDDVDMTDENQIVSPAINEKILEIDPPSNTLRKTRSMTSDPHVVKCLEILEEPLPPFSIDHSALKALLDSAVLVAHGASVVQLEKLYSLLAQKIYHHRMLYDRSQMLKEIQEVIANFTH